MQKIRYSFENGREDSAVSKPMPKAVLKTEFRDTARASRAAQYGQWSPDERVFINASLTQHCCSLVQQTHAQRICAYIPVGNEPGNRAWLDTLAAHCTALFLPRSEDHGRLTWGLFTEWGELEEGRFRIPQPRTCIPHLLTTPPGVDLILLPAISVGRDGSRMGKGAGYYDRALADIHTAVAAGNLAAAPVLAAIVYSSELVDIVPTESHDVRMDWVVTPTELHNCAQPSA